MKSIIEKLGFPQPPWNWEDTSWHYNLEGADGTFILESELPNIPNEKEKGLIAASPELLEALIEMVISGLNYYDLLPNSHRKTAEEYYKDEISIIEKATGKSWEEIKELISD